MKRKIVMMEVLVLIILIMLALLVHADKVSMEGYVRSEYLKVYADVVEIKHEPAGVKYHYDYSGGTTKIDSERNPEICKVVLRYGDTTQEYDSLSIYNKCKGKNKVKVQICILDYKDKREIKITDVY